MSRQLFSGILLLTFFSSVSAATHVSDVLNKPGRLASDVQRDQRSQPAKVLPLLALEAGDRVADIFAGGGYYSEILAGLVTPGGEAILHNNAAYATFARSGLQARFEGREIAGVTQLVSETSDLKLGRETLDGILLVMSYHDLYYVDEDNGWPAIDAPGFLRQLAAALQPDGRLMIIDHAAQPGTGKAAAQTLHRIDVDFAIADIQQYGLCLAARSGVLANAGDDHSKSVFAEDIRGRTDRFVLVFSKGSC